MRTTAILTAMILAANASAQAPPPVPGLPGLPGTAPPAIGTTPAPKPPTELEALIAKTLKQSPDVKVAEARLAEAEALLHAARIAAVQKLLDVRGRIDAAKAKVAAAEATLRNQKRLSDSGATSATELQAAEANLTLAKADLARLESELGAVFGDVLARAEEKRDRIGLELEVTSRLPKRSQAGDILIERSNHVGGSVAERVRVALDVPVKIGKTEGDLALAEVLKLLQPAKGEPVPYLVQPGAKSVKAFALMEAELPLGAWLLAVEDSSPDVRFVVREYGVLVTTKDRIPEGAVPLRAFWHGRPETKPLPPRTAPTPKP